MSGQADSAVRRGGADAELALRAARRIGAYLTTHPGADPVSIQGELAGDDALVVPREAAVLLARILGFLANGEGVNVIPDTAELTTRQAARVPALPDQAAGVRGDPVPAGRYPSPGKVPGSGRVQEPSRPGAQAGGG